MVQEDLGLDTPPAVVAELTAIEPAADVRLPNEFTWLRLPAGLGGLYWGLQKSSSDIAVSLPRRWGRAGPSGVLFRAETIRRGLAFSLAIRRWGVCSRGRSRNVGNAA